ncbi:MAG: hypothetical protein MHPSP_003122, partial [Paramarteilia canceri]
MNRTVLIVFALIEPIISELGKETSHLFDNTENIFNNTAKDKCQAGTYAGLNDEVCDSCDEGHNTSLWEATELSNCNKCKFAYKYSKSNGDKVKCTVCEIGKFASLKDLHNSTECRIQLRCLDDEFYEPKQEKCIQCSEALIGSIGRKKETQPMFNFCECSDSQDPYTIKLYIKCVSKKDDKELYNIVDQHLAHENYTLGKYFLRYNNSLHYHYRNCHPLIDGSFSDGICLCSKGYIFSPAGCIECIKGSENETCLVNIEDNLLKNFMIDDCRILKFIKHDSKPKCIECISDFEIFEGKCKPKEKIPF